MPEQFSYDVFLSHNAQDKPRVRKLAERLKAAGLRVWFDEWLIEPGDDIYLAIERGLEAARVQILCLSPTALGSEWVALERSTVLFRDPTNAGRRFIPLLLADCDLSDTLRRYKYVDFREESVEAFASLLNACGRSDYLAGPTVPDTDLHSASSPEAEGIRVIQFGCSIRETAEGFQYNLSLETVNDSSQTFGWSGLSISVPTSGITKWSAPEAVKAEAAGGQMPQIYHPGDEISRFVKGHGYERFAGRDLLVESVVNIWQPRQIVDMRLILSCSMSRLRVGIRAWANCDLNDWTNSVIGDPIWTSSEYPDQQGLPAYWHSLSIR